MENSAQGNTQDTQPDINPYFLRYLREKVVQVTQEELASEMNVDAETVKHWETGRRQPSQKHLLALERYFGIKAGSLALEMQQILVQDFNAAYFGDTDARERLEWVDRNRKLGQALRIIPVPSTTRTAELLAALLEDIS